ncbi:unnamed protein product [Nesidiocoris tenuis]|uniref:Nipped-B protein n=2 Tax=Nesidiocoris tenuis TaxID=355587 RepID=A0A6H5GUF1_9HEMI|nr:Nipped-B homolog (Drosophila) [Nesidiocoris tenuis]CAB0006468.1 unnamed protein product [Nesidiocoris tenuis]
MNGEIPSVPITTLAGISSLSDLLPEMPLPSPLPQSMGNKSLLFHPRVAEEANNLLNLKDETLLVQLAQSLSQTSAINIELKDAPICGENIKVEMPELLKSVLTLDPKVFEGTQANMIAAWNPPGVALEATASTSVISPLIDGKSLANNNTSTHSPIDANDNKFLCDISKNLLLDQKAKPDFTQSVISSWHTPSTSGTQPTSLSSIPSVPGSSSAIRSNFDIAKETTTTTKLSQPEVPSTPPTSNVNRGVIQSLSTHQPSKLTTDPSTKTPDHLKSSTSATPAKTPVSVPSLYSPASSSSPRPRLPVERIQNDFSSKIAECLINQGFIKRTPDPSKGEPEPEVKIENENGEDTKEDESKGTANCVNSKKGVVNKPLGQPIVRLDILSVEDQMMMQKSLNKFVEIKPELAVKCGLLPKGESDSEEEAPRNRRRIFKARDKERGLQKQKVMKEEEELNDSKRKRRQTRSDDPNYDAKEEDDEDDDDDESADAAPKHKYRKIVKKAVVMEKLSVDELMETNTYQRFIKSIERIFEDVEDIDLVMDMGEDADCPSEALISKYQLQDLCSEAAKLNSSGGMKSIPSIKLIKLLTILERNIRDGAKVSPISDPNDDEEERKLFMELAMDRVMRAVDASLTALYILTSPNMHKQVYLEDVIDRIIIFTKFQLHNTIYPAYDPVYRVQTKEKDGLVTPGRKKRGHTKEVREKTVLTLYTKLTEVVSLLGELISIQKLTDNAVLHASSMGISPFFVERVSEMQLAALKLVTTIFAKYEKHRKLLLDDILASMARLPSSKRSLRSYRLSSEEYIQMLTALVLQLVQCMIQIPPDLTLKSQSTAVDPDIVIVGKFKTARSTASNFLYIFLAKCSSKSEEIDYRPLFENFVQDLLTTVNKPEWPAAELMLSVLGNLLVNNFVNKSLEMPLRVASLDYLGVVAARLRKDAVTSHLKVSTIDQIIKEIKLEEARDDDGSLKGSIKPVKDEDERTQFLQKVLLDYLDIRGQTEPVLMHARHFYIAQWYQDVSKQTTTPQTTPKKPKKAKKKRGRKVDSSEEDDTESEVEETAEEENPVANLKINDSKKHFLLSKISTSSEGSEGKTTSILQTFIDYPSAELITRYLASKRPFSQSFNVYLKHILKVLTETSVLIRTKAMKCLTSIVEVDPSVLGLKEMQLGVKHSFLDHSTSVREAAVDLVGKFILSRPELIPKYYDMLSARILDTGVSVRKRVIKILKDVCVDCPTFSKIPEICVKIIRRVNDEDGIRKLVLEVFQTMWFSPVREKPLDADALVRKVMNITDAVAATNDLCLEWFENLLLSLFKPKEDAKEDTTKAPVEVPKTILLACQQIVDCLIETVVRLDGQGDDSQRLVSCMLLLNLFAKIRPQLLVQHATVLQPYLSLKCKTQGDYQIISCVARTLELVVPLIEHPSEMFLAHLEEDSVKLMMQQDPAVVQSCVACLGSIVNNVTRNFSLIRDCLKQYHDFLTNFKNTMENPSTPQETLVMWRPHFRRSLFVVGLLLRFFDFNDPEVIGDQLPRSIKDDVFETFLYFLHKDDSSKHYTLKAVGAVCIRHYELMLQTELKALYRSYLSDPNAPLLMKVQVLNNIENYLLEEERKMIKQDQEWAKMAKQENLKEMGDVTSGMASTVIQVFLKDVLESFIHPHNSVRGAALKVIQLILNQGLVHPVQMVPYLICMSTDCDRTLSVAAERQLQEIEKKYPGFIHMKAQNGIRLSYKLQRLIQSTDVIRGFRLKEGELPAALNGFLYSILKTKQQRRALVMSILKQFDEQVKTTLSQMLYLVDNMAYFPYQVQDEPLFIIHHIDVMLSVTGTNLLQSFRESLIPINPEQGQEGYAPNEDEDEDEDEETLLSRIPEDTTALQQCLTASQGCLLLLVLKQHLKTLYGFNDAKITQYSPTESSKVYEKSVSRKSNSKFNPKGTIQKLKQGTPPAVLDEEARRALVTEYLEFKTLVMNLDPDDCDDDDDGGGRYPPGEGGGVILRVREIIQKKTEESEAAAAADGSPPKVPKLTIIKVTEPPRSLRHKSRKTERHKKHNHKRKRKISSDDSDEDYNSDPDYCA